MQLDELLEIFDERLLPNDLKISTMTVNCSLPFEFDILNIGESLPLVENIVSIQYSKKELLLNEEFAKLYGDKLFLKELEKELNKNKSFEILILKLNYLLENKLINLDTIENFSEFLNLIQTTEINYSQEKLKRAYKEFIKNNINNLEIDNPYLITFMGKSYSKVNKSFDEFYRKNKLKKEENKKKNFFNQVTIIFKLYLDKPKNNNAMNIKIFSNGNIQITGCPSIRQLIGFLTNLLNIFEQNNKEHQYCNEIITFDKIYDMQVRLANVCGKVNFMINRSKLANILEDFNLEYDFVPENKASIDIKYITKDNKDVIIKVFESGKYNINGSNTIEQINECYNFLTKLFYEKFNQIIKIKNDTIYQLLSK